MIDEAMEPNDPSPAIEIPPPPRSCESPGRLDMEKPPLKPIDDRLPVVRLPVTAASVFCV